MVLTSQVHCRVPRTHLENSVSFRHPPPWDSCLHTHELHREHMCVWNIHVGHPPRETPQRPAPAHSVWPQPPEKC